MALLLVVPKMAKSLTIVLAVTNHGISNMFLDIPPIEWVVQYWNFKLFDLRPDLERLEVLCNQPYDDRFAGFLGNGLCSFLFTPRHGDIFLISY